MKVTLKINAMNIMCWFIDSSHQVHDDCKGRTGGALMIEEGAILSSSSGQKINTKSSSKTEVVGVDDLLPRVLWSMYFVEARGYTIDNNIINQDNESSLRLMINRRMSSTPRTRHIKAKYFFAKDKHDQGEIEFRKCHTKDMWIDMNTKPKQGARAPCRVISTY